MCALIPEPLNPYDHNAVAIDLGGTRIGYIQAKLANAIFPHIRTLNHQGYECRIPVQVSRNKYDRSLEIFACAPTIKRCEQEAPMKEMHAALNILWRGLPQECRDEIERNGFHLTPSTCQTIIEHSHLAPTLPLLHARASLETDISVQMFLKKQRQKRNAAKKRATEARKLEAERQRTAKREAREQAARERKAEKHEANSREKLNRSIKQVAKIGDNTATTATDAESGITARPTDKPAPIETSSDIVMTDAARTNNLRNARDTQGITRDEIDDLFMLLVRSGLTRTELSEQLGMRRSKIAYLSHKNNVTITGDASLTREQTLERAKKCMLAFRLHSKGATRKDIAIRLECDRYTLQDYLRDARFYSNPEKYPYRTASNVELTIIKMVSDGTL